MFEIHTTSGRRDRRPRRPKPRRCPPRIHLLVIAMLLMSASSCRILTPPMVETRTHVAASLPVRTIAVVPFRISHSLANTSLPTAIAAAARLSQNLDQALIDAQLAIVPSEQVRSLLATEPVLALDADPRAVIARVGTEYAVDAVLFGQLVHLRERSGSAAGSTVPASVSFEVALRSTVNEKILWSAAFDETQPSLMEDPQRAAQLPGGGTRWLKAEELARFGAGRIASALARYVEAAASKLAASRTPLALPESDHAKPASTGSLR